MSPIGRAISGARGEMQDLSCDIHRGPTPDHAGSSARIIFPAFRRYLGAFIRQRTAIPGAESGNMRVNCAEGNRGRSGSVDVVTRNQLRHCQHWQHAFASQHKDHRYYELVDDTINPEFKYLYFVIRDSQELVETVQPFFVLDQDILAGVRPYCGRLIDTIRLQWPRFMYMKTLMVGCAAGEAHLDDGSDFTRAASADLLAKAIVRHARALGARLIVLKEFPRQYREVLSCFVRHGFTRIPSMPLTLLNIDYPSFDEYMRCALNSATRSKLKKKFKAAEQATPIELSVTNDVTPIISEIYPLYLLVYERSKLHFEKLTREYFCQLGRALPEKVRFFIWRQNGKAVAFAECMVHEDTMFAEYLGLDYSVALKLHLYHYVFRGLVRWGMENGYKWFQSSGLNYDPKLHLRYRLEPVDLYVKHTSAIINMIMRAVLPWLAPVRYDKTLKKFSNYSELWE